MIDQKIANIIGIPDYYVDEYNSTPMMNFWCIIGRLAKIIHPESVCEIGSERGLTSRHIAGTLPELKVWVVDPVVHDSVKAMSNVVACEETSKQFFTRNERIPFYIVDGDHNYETVSMEIELAARNRPMDAAFCMIFHDVGWPFAERDGYYNPLAMVEPFEHRYDVCLKLEKDQPTAALGGFENGRTFALAENSGGSRNGVRTAINDFVKRNPGEWDYVSIPIFYGLGILVNRKSLSVGQSAEFDGLTSALEMISPMLSCAEANRLRLLQGLSEHRHDLVKCRDQLEMWQRSPLKATVRHCFRNLRDKARQALS